MTSRPDPAEPSHRHPVRALFTAQMVIFAWLPAVVITTLHYGTPGANPAMHHVLRRLYYLPILLAAFGSGLRGGLLLAVLIAIAYSPHAFGSIGHGDPANTLEKSLELVLYVVVGGVAGALVDREQRRQRQLSATAAELQRALDDQRRTSEQLVRAGRLAALGEMVAGIAHEIKNPLHSLRGTAEVVDEAVPADAPQRRMWELHIEEIERLSRVADRFLSFARPVPPERKAVQLQRVVDRAVTLLRAQAKKLSVSLDIAGPPASLAPIEADEEQLVQVLLNIALNALQAIEGQGAKHGSIVFAVSDQMRRGRRYQLVNVTNNGPPIAPERLERIFDPFVTDKSGGSGLGLSIAARIIEQHDGFIQVHNNKQGGVTFSVSLPVAGAR